MKGCYDADNVKGYVKCFLQKESVGDYDPRLNARRVCAHLKSVKGPVAIPTPTRCYVEAPTDVNVYTDGSWLNGVNKHFSLGGAGVWWPARALKRGDLSTKLSQVRPISEAEQEIAHYRQENDGVALFASIGGYSGSSTRAELGAGIIAACAPGPIHLASDSEVFVNGVNQLVDHINEGRPVRINWKLISDGDLWEHMFRVLSAKGPRTFKATWVKGHATDKHVESGVITAIHKAGNHRADALADAGNQMHGEDAITILGAMTCRFHGYVNFMQKVVHHLIEGYLIHRTLMDQADRLIKSQKADIDRSASYSSLAYPVRGDTRSLVPWSSVHCHANFRNSHPASESIETFLSQLQVVEATTAMRGITWLELYVLYRVRGGAKPIPDPTSAAAARATVDKQLRAFKQTLRGVIDRTIDPEVDGRLFQADCAKLNALKGVGILGKHPTLSFNAYINDIERETIAIALSTLVRGGSMEKHKQYVKGNINLIPHELKLKGKAAWDSNLPIKATRSTSGGKWADLFKEERFQPPPTAVFHSCPECGGLESSLRARFQRNDLDVKLKCGFCLKAFPLKRWLCECAQPWHACETHAGCFKPRDDASSGGQLLNGHLSEPARGSGNEARVRTRRLTTPESILADDSRRAKAQKVFKKGEKRKADVILGDVPVALKRPTLLGPILNERFNGASSSSSSGVCLR